jgi:hypothetical protein
MRSTIALRLASILTLIYCAGHTRGAVLGAPRHGAEEAQVIETMRSHTFLFSGSLRSYWDFHTGYGLLLSAALLCQGVVLWFLSRLARAQPAMVRPIVICFALENAASAIVAWQYFFIAPTVMQSLIAACLVAALLVKEPA